jgi:hypothetical protein
LCPGSHAQTSPHIVFPAQYAQKPANAQKRLANPSRLNTRAVRLGGEGLQRTCRTGSTHCRSQRAAIAVQTRHLHKNRHLG